MPIARFQLPDGRIAKFEVPEGTTPEQAMAEIEKHLASAPPVEQAKSEPSTADRIAGNPLTRFALGAASPFLGLAQLGAETFGNKGISEHLKELEAMKRRGMGEGWDIAGLAGTVLSPAALAAMKIPLAATRTGRVGQGAAVGAGLGATSPATSDDFWKEKGIQAAVGGSIGAAVPPVVEGVSKVVDLGRRLLDPKAGAQKILAEAAGDKRAAIEDALEQSVYVPGSKPTAAEAATPAGSPTFSALQNVVKNKYPDRFSDIATEQANVRSGLIGSFAKNKQAVQEATEARSAAAGHNYGNVRDFLVRMDEEIMKLLDRPSMSKAVSRAEELAREQGKTLGADVGSLHQVKMALDDMTTNPERFGIGASEVRAIAKTRAEFLSWLEKKAPLYQKARETHAAMSKPINEMQVGQQLEQALTKPLGEGERAGVYAQAMRDAPGTIKKATGQPRFDELDEVLSQENLAKAKTVLSDLSRKAEQERLASLGRARAAEITGMPNPLPGLGPFQQGYTTIRAILSRITKGVTDRTIKEVADAISTPENALRLLRSAPDSQRAKMIEQLAARRLGVSASMAAAAGVE